MRITFPRFDTLSGEQVSSGEQILRGMPGQRRDEGCQDRTQPIGIQLGIPQGIRISSTPTLTGSSSEIIRLQHNHSV